MNLQRALVLAATLAGSASLERRSAGAMCQWGRHATAFVARRGFDDAHLFEQRFKFDVR